MSATDRHRPHARRAPALVAGFALATLAGALSAQDFPDPSSFFADGFESGATSSVNGRPWTPVVNTAGFAWEGNNATSIVTMESGQPYAIFNNGIVHNPGPVGSDWTAKDGANSMRFRYPANTPNWNAEQRFDLGTARREVWIRYWVRVPTSFDQDLSGANGWGNKYFALWMDNYDAGGQGTTIIWGVVPGASGEMVLNCRTGYGGMTNGTAPHSIGSGDVHFFNYPADLGRWMQVVLHARASSTDTAFDGLMETYRRWDGEATWTTIHSVANAFMPLPPSGTPAGWKAGYFFGWTNPGFLSQTEWLVDDVEMSASSLVGAPSPVAPAITAQPVDQTVNVGATATFTVTATGTPTPTYQWRTGGVDISGATSASYTTPATTLADNGTAFSVVVTNTAGTATSASATLTVSSPSTPPDHAAGGGSSSGCGAGGVAGLVLGLGLMLRLRNRRR